MVRRVEAIRHLAYRLSEAVSQTTKMMVPSYVCSLVLEMSCANSSEEDVDTQYVKYTFHYSLYLDTLLALFQICDNSTSLLVMWAQVSVPFVNNMILKILATGYMYIYFIFKLHTCILSYHTTPPHIRTHTSTHKHTPPHISTHLHT